MNNKSDKIAGQNLTKIEKKTTRRAYSTPRLVCYGDFNEITRNGGNNPVGGDFLYVFETGYGDID